MDRRAFLTVTGIGALSGCLGRGSWESFGNANVPTPEYASHDFYFGFDGYGVDSEITITDEDSAPLNYAIQQRGNTIDDEQSVVFEFAVTNDSEQPVSSMSLWPAPFGFVDLEDIDRRRPIHPWSDAYGDRVSETRGPIPPGDAAVWMEIKPGETITEEFELAYDTHGIVPGTYQFEMDYPISVPDEHDPEWTVYVDLRVEISRPDTEPEPGEPLRDIVHREQESPSDFGGSLSVDVLEPITDRHPGLIEIAFVSEWDERKLVTAEPGFPFEAYDGKAESGGRLVVMPQHMYAPGHVVNRDGCWQPEFHPGSDRRTIRSKTGFDPGERRSRRFVVLAHPESNDNCLAPMDYQFSQQYTLVSMEHDVEDQEVELGFTLTLL